jgi:RNA polymerase sigma-70 factor (ECF subfamily)
MNDERPDGEETERLLGRAQAGDPQAFERLFADHLPYLRRVVELRLDPRLRPRVDASDVVQETHLEALRRLGAYLERRPLPFRLWLRQIACDCAAKAHRHHLGAARRDLAREVALPEESSLALAEQLAAGGSSPSRQLDRRDLARRLREAVERLPKADREVILLRHFEGLSNQEVGCLLGEAPGTVSKRHGRALLRLHQLLFADGLTESQL